MDWHRSWQESGQIEWIAKPNPKVPPACCKGDWIWLWDRSTGNSGSKTGGFNQADLITPGREFTALIALNHHAATGLDPNDAGSNPAKGCGFKHFYDIAGL
jgi:hypothetical protein